MKFISCFLLILSTTLFAQRPVLLTERASTLGQWKAEVGVAASYFKRDATKAIEYRPNELRRDIESLWRVGELFLHLGVAENVDFQLDWRGRLIGHFPDGSEGTDWGDLSVSTKINFITETLCHPAFGIRTLVKLPNTSYEPHRLGTDAADFVFSILSERSFSTIDLRSALGLMILGNPREISSQDDIYFMSAAMIFKPVGFPMQAFIEGYGCIGYKEDDDKLLLRSGFLADALSLHWSLFGSARLAGTNGDFGTPFEQSEDWGIGFAVTKSLAF